MYGIDFLSQTAPSADSTGAPAGSTGASDIILNIDGAQFKAMKGMGAFDGIKYTTTMEGSVANIRMSQAEYQKFQARQGSNASIGE